MRSLRSFFSKSNQGPYLNLNEDSVFIDLNQMIFGVLDAFGGTGISESNLKLVKESIEHYFSKVSGDPDATMPYFYSPQYILETNALINSLYISHRKLLEKNSTKQIKDMGGVSISLTMLSENILSIVSCGNCCALLYRDGNLSLLNTPDCSSPISYSDNSHHKKTFPLVSLGLFKDLTPKVWEMNVSKDDKVIILSDGVFGTLSMMDIKRVLDHVNLTEEEQVSLLFQMANKKGNQDNQSAIIYTID